MRKGESIYERKDGRFEGRYIKKYKDGKAVYGFVYAKTYNECKKKRNLIVYNTKVEKPKRVNNSGKDLNYLIDNWLIKKQLTLKESSYSSYYNLINQHIKNEIGKVKINKLNTDMINLYLNNKLSKGKLDSTGGLKKNTVYMICTVLRQVFKENNIQIDMMKIPLITGVGKSLYNDERKELISKLNSINNNISIGILLSLFLGLRKSEVCGIRYSDIDLENKVLHINNIVTRVKSFNTKNKTKLILTKPKTDRSMRVLPIPDKLVELIKGIKSDDSNVFLLSNTDKLMEPKTFYNHYKKILKELDIDYTYHDLRHTFATNCIENGIDYKSLMELLGHSNVTTTMNIYVHPSLNDKRNFINLL